MVTVDLEKCIGCGECEDVCTFGAISVVDEKAVVDQDTCTLCGACEEACPEGAIEIEGGDRQAPGTDLVDWQGVWVVAEIRHGKFAPVTFELLGKGRQLADDLDTGLTAVLMGSGVREHAQALVERGADRVLVVDNPALEQFLDDAYARILAHMASEEKPEVILAGATAMGRAFIPQVATLLETGLTADCTGLEISPEGRDLLQTRPAFGGNLMATIICDTRRPQMATVRPHVLKAPEPDTSRKGEILDVEPPEKLFESRLRVLESVVEEAEGPMLTDAEIVITAGRGVENPKNIALIEKLAHCMDAGVGATRAVTDAEWLPGRCQIGQTGVTVSPKLYMGFGVSGAIQHLVGMQGSEIIVAVNKDPDAPIFDIATYGIVGDVKEILPLLVRRICKERGVEDA
jgi:electron transfer flavoprotein alpha subunit